MIKRYYEVLCDNCGDLIDYYPYCKPSIEEFHRNQSTVMKSMKSKKTDI